MPGNGHRPLLLIDVDGVISLYGFAPDERPGGAFLMVDGIAHFLSGTAGEHLRELGECFELTWCTGWEEKANEYLPHALSLRGPLPYVPLSGHPVAHAHWKLGGIAEYVDPHRPVAWIDDAHDDACREWAAARPGATLLVGTDPPTGLTAEHVATLKRWAAGLS